MSHFNESAATWDDPRKTEMMQLLAGRTIAALQNENCLRDDLDIVDFGCGTGLFGLAFLPFARTLTGIDTSPGMLDVFANKTAGDERIRTVCADLTSTRVALPADLILSSMAFHHLADPVVVLQKLADMRRAGGVIAVVDLDAEDGTFHADNAGMGVLHFGFSQSAVEIWATACNLSLRYEIIHAFTRNDREVQMFLAIMR